MKKNVRRALAISGMALAIGASGLTLPASADSNINRRSSRINSQVNVEKIARKSRIERWGKTASVRRVIPGVVSEKSDDSLIIRHGSKTYIVTITDATKKLDRKWQAIDLASINTGDKIRVLGAIEGSAITAQTIRDISIPKNR